MKLSKPFFILGCLAVSATSMAAIPADAQPFQLVIPNLRSGLEFAIEGLLVRPNIYDTAYGVVAPVTVTANSENHNATILNQDPGMDGWAFRAAVGYIFSNSGNDVQLAWTHFFPDTNNASGVFRPGDNLITASGFTQTFPASLTGQINAISSMTTHYDAIDLDVGQYIDVGTRLRLRAFAGLRAAQVQNDAADYYYTPAPFTGFVGTAAINGVYVEQDQLNAKFTGIGPRFGIDSSYHISNCFGLVTQFAGILLVGEAKSSTNTFASLQETIELQEGSPLVINSITSSNNTFSNNPTRVVPAFDAKLGLDYSYIFSNQSVLSVEAGYKVTEYINALEKIHAIATVALPQQAPTFSATSATSSIGFDGPYVSVNYKV